MLQKEIKKAIVDKLDEWIKFKGLLETVDSLAFSAALSGLDSGLLDKINEQYHNIINEILEAAFVNEDYETAKDKMAILLADTVTTPIVDGTAEEIQLYESVLNVIHSVIEYYFNK